jgi:hypothetical protein
MSASLSRFRERGSPEARSIPSTPERAEQFVPASIESAKRLQGILQRQRNQADGEHAPILQAQPDARTPIQAGVRGASITALPTPPPPTSSPQPAAASDAGRRSSSELLIADLLDEVTDLKRQLALQSDLLNEVADLKRKLDVERQMHDAVISERDELQARVREMQGGAAAAVGAHHSAVHARRAAHGGDLLEAALAHMRPAILGRAMNEWVRAVAAIDQDHSRMAHTQTAIHGKWALQRAFTLEQYARERLTKSILRWWQHGDLSRGWQLWRNALSAWPPSNRMS